MSFVNLHNHFDYSILDGGMKVERGVSRAVELGQPAIAITDHGTMGGAYELHKQATAAGVKPIIGIEAYVAPGDAQHKSPIFWGQPHQRRDDISGAGKYLHLTILARSAEGLRNLYRLQHAAYNQGFYGKPRMDFGMLAQHSEGLTVLTGCPGSHLQTSLRLGRFDLARDFMARLTDIFAGNLFIEVMDHGLPIESAVKSELLDVAEYYNLPLVATADAHYAHPDDRGMHDALLCIQTKAKLSDTDRFRFEGSYALASLQEMERTFPLEYLRNTLAIAESVEGYGDLFERTIRLPKYSDQEELDLATLVYAGLQDLGIAEDPAYAQRAEYELDVVNSQGFAGYFLTLKEIVGIAKAHSIRVGPGRGSAGGSLISYALGLTKLDSVVHGLLFERFLNPERISLPDIDVDIDDARRDEFLQLVRERYGDNYVAQIGTYGIIGAKSALKDSARLLGYEYATGERLVGMLPPPKFGRQPTLESLPAKAEPKEVVATARSVEGIIRNSGIHASGVIVSPDNLVDLIPLRIPGGKRGLTTEFTGTELDELGYVKYDFLGLATLGVIDEALLLLNGRNQPIELPTAFNDPATFEILSSGETSGVFQLDGYGMRKLLQRVQPCSLGDIAAVLALYRPGPMGANAHNEFADRKNGRSRIQYPHPEYEGVLADILSETYGLIVFQEQVLRILAAVGGYTYASAGLIFDAMRKKDMDKMLAAKPDFEERLRANGYSTDAIEALWDVLVPFSDYSFNKAHATGYGMLSYWTAYLKANHTAPYYCALLSKEKDTDKLHEYIRCALSDGVPILPPDINDSNYGWTLTDEGIRFGLGSVKGISKATYEHIAAGRPYLSMEEWWRRAHPKVLNLSVLTAAVRCGAFDRLEPNREQLAENCENLAARALADRELAAKGQTRLWRGYEVLPGRRKLGLRQSWELEALGIALTTRAVTVKLRRRLQQDEWVYLRKVMEAHPGNAPVNVVIGPLTTLRSLSTISLTPKALKELGALTAIEVEEQE